MELPETAQHLIGLGTVEHSCAQIKWYKIAEGSSSARVFCLLCDWIENVFVKYLQLQVSLSFTFWQGLGMETSPNPLGIHWNVCWKAFTSPVCAMSPVSGESRGIQQNSLDHPFGSPALKMSRSMFHQVEPGGYWSMRWLCHVKQGLPWTRSMI